MLKKKIKLAFLSFCLLFAPSSLFAFEISSFSDIPIKGDIVLFPAKAELSINKGENSTKFIDVLNRTGKDQVFSLDVEDFASPVGSDSVSLGKTVDGLNSSLKDYIKVAREEFVLAHGQQAHIPVLIDIPKDVSPGGLYGSVLVSGRPVKNVSGATNVVTRIGALFFVKVNGEVKQSGKLNSLTFDGKNLNIEFINDGDIYLNPYGIINVYEYYTRKLVTKLVVDPWFVLPRSTRTRSMLIDGLGGGNYAAEITLNRGYDNMIDNKFVNFEIPEVKKDQSISTVIAGGTFGLIILIILMFYVRF